MTTHSPMNSLGIVAIGLHLQSQMIEERVHYISVDSVKNTTTKPFWTWNRRIVSDTATNINFRLRINSDYSFRLWAIVNTETVLDRRVETLKQMLALETELIKSYIEESDKDA